MSNVIYRVREGVHGEWLIDRGQMVFERMDTLGRVASKEDGHRIVNAMASNAARVAREGSSVVVAAVKQVNARIDELDRVMRAASNKAEHMLFNDAGDEQMASSAFRVYVAGRTIAANADYASFVAGWNCMAARVSKPVTAPAAEPIKLCEALRDPDSTHAECLRRTNLYKQQIRAHLEAGDRDFKALHVLVDRYADAQHAADVLSGQTAPDKAMKV